jgi:hypothetical protein
MTTNDDGYEVEPDLLEKRIGTLSQLGDLTADLVATATRLAERLPMLGTAPPAVDLSQRLREAAGNSGLAGEVSAAEREVRAFQQLLSDTKGSYREADDAAASSVRGSEGGDGRGEGGGAGSEPGQRSS